MTAKYGWMRFLSSSSAASFAAFAAALDRQWREDVLVRESGERMC